MRSMTVIFYFQHFCPTPDLALSFHRFPDKSSLLKIALVSFYLDLICKENLPIRVICFILMLVLQWTPLKGITDIGVNRLMGSKLSRVTSPQITLSYLMYDEAHLRNIISQLLESVFICPEVISLSSFHCIFHCKFCHLRLFESKSFYWKRVLFI